ncbi:hypothetical protein D3C85_629970 [compost metagenome]
MQSLQQGIEHQIHVRLARHQHAQLLQGPLHQRKIRLQQARLALFPLQANLLRVGMRDQVAQLAGTEGRGHPHRLVGAGQHLLQGFFRADTDHAGQLFEQCRHGRRVPTLQGGLADTHAQVHSLHRRVALGGTGMGQARQLPEVPAAHQALGQLAEAGAQHLANRPLRFHARLRQQCGQFIGLFAAAAPERQLAEVVQQGGDEHFLLAARQQVAGYIACLHRGMEGPRQELRQLLSWAAGQQAVDQAHRQADQAHVLEADQDDGAGYGANGLLGRVVVDAVGDLEHLRGQGRVTQQHIGQLLDRGFVLLGHLVQVLHHRGQGG